MALTCPPPEQKINMALAQVEGAMIEAGWLDKENLTGG